MEHRAVKYFREYLRIPTVHPDVEYDDCVKFLESLGTDCGLKCTIHGTSKKPIVLLTWQGTDKNAGSILLNSHMDVVPADKTRWTHDPFEAFKDESGNIYGRGSQDTKEIGIQYVEAIRCLIEEGIQPKRTVYISYVPDEEIGGIEGMGSFINTNEFQNLNIEFALDEGGACPENKLIIFNDERCTAHLKITCKGPTGHGSLLFENTAGEKLVKVLDELMNFRESQVMAVSKLPHPLLYLSYVTTVNLTKVEGGVQNNVVPPELSMTYDVRLSVNTDHEEFFDWIKAICSNAGKDVTYEILEYNPKAPKTETDESNRFWMAIKEALDEMNVEYNVVGCPGATDARFVRRVGIPALGLSPMKNTPILLHSDNEMLNEKVFLEGIDIYKNIIRKLVNC
ncbi:hypothetical protein O3M35_001510 [Rhynocoris fuscipes]|uniref:N-acyl-aliphatic-L-amino acid amidohydrolase n=1 Tax=Rhynocoris fuscipes TaxID=488301 RepID=A0AAW1CNR2_9HEMI